MPAVSNTSPLSNLAILDRLDLLREQFGQVLIPVAVDAELKRHPQAIARKRLEVEMNQGWLQIVPISTPIPENLAASLHRGEAEAITLALALKADWVLLDESDARRAAKWLGLPHTGVLGVLRKAKGAGQLASLREEIKRLRADAHFFVHPDLERELLISVGEG